MTKLNSNDLYVEFAGVNVSAHFTAELKYSASRALVEVTAGAGVEYIQRQTGLGDTKLTLSLAYTIAAFETYRQILVTGAEGLLVYGPEGRVAGKPRFECVMIVESFDMVQSIKKEFVVCELSLAGKDAPVMTIEGGGKF